MLNSFFRPKVEISRQEFILLYALGIISIFLFWSAITFSGIVSGLFLSNPLDTFTKVMLLFTENGILPDVLITISRVIVGFAVSLSIGIPLGLFLGTFSRIEAFTEPLINLFRYIPAAAVVPLAILWFGIGETQKYFIVFFGTFPFVVLYTTYAIASVEKKLFYSAYSLGADTKTVLGRVALAKALPQIYEICRIELGGAWGLIILAEIVAATTGLGHRLILSQRFLQTPALFAVILIILAVGLAADQTMKFGYKKLFPWAEKNKVQ